MQKHPLPALFAFSIIILSASGAHASHRPHASTAISQQNGGVTQFQSSRSLTTAALSANITNVQVTTGMANANSMAPSGIVLRTPATHHAGAHNNIVSNHAFEGAFGVIGVNQNSGVNSINQQAVVFKANDITLSTLH